jgi:hypothetical protein
MEYKSAWQVSGIVKELTRAPSSAGFMRRFTGLEG